MKFFLILIAIFFAFFSSPHEVRALQEKSLSQSFTLDNGMRFLVIPKPGVKAITQMIWYKVGGIDEAPGKSGLAHFFEHLLFKETKNLADGEFSKIVARHGGNENAFTTQDYTTYFQNTSKDNLDLSMKLEAERMQNLKLNKEVIEKEQKIVTEERRMRVDNNPYYALIEQMRATLYLNHPYGKPVIGWMHEIEALSLEDSIEFYKNNYSPDNAFIIISGDVTIDEVRPIAEKYFGSIPPSNTKKTLLGRELIEPKHITARYVFLENSMVQKTEWARYYLAPSLVSGETEYAIPLILLSQILGGGETSRLYQSLVIDQKLAAQASSYYDELALGQTTLGLYITPKKGVPLKEIDLAIAKEIQLLIENSVSDEELRRAKNLLVAETIYARDSLMGMAIVYGQTLATGLKPSYVDDWPKNISSVTKEEILAAARAILTPERSVTGFLKIKNEAKR